MSGLDRLQDRADRFGNSLKHPQHFSPGQLAVFRKGKRKAKFVIEQIIKPKMQRK